MKKEVVDEIFDRAYGGPCKEIPFIREWSNGAGMFDHAVYGEHAPKLANGEMVKSITPGKRRILIVGTHLGNLVIFDRVTPGVKGANLPAFAYNTTSAVMSGGWFSNAHLNAYEMELAVGEETAGNLGWRIDQIVKLAKKRLREVSALK